MVQAINSQNITVQKSANKPVNILTRSKAKVDAFRDTFNKSDNDTKAKVNAGLGVLSVLGAIVGFAGAKNMISRSIGALLAFASGASLAALNMPQNISFKKEKAQTEEAPKQEEMQQAAADLTPEQANAIAQALAPAPATDVTQTQVTQG